MQTEAYGKINLTLDVTGRDERGYHLLSSVFAEISLSDTVVLTPVGSSVTMRCSDPALPTDGRNLCVKAAERFLDAFALSERGFRIDLIKRIPSCAGLGGGSSDAAAVIKLLCQHFGISVNHPKVQAVALSAGADVSFFFKGGCCLAEGIGEILTPLPTPLESVVLIAKTREAASTPQVYGAYDELGVVQPCATPQLCRALKEGRPVSPYVSNHLTVAATRFCPSVERLKGDMRRLGALCSEMTGSGSAVYGLFSDEAAAQNAKKAIDVQFCEICRFVK